VEITGSEATLAVPDPNRFDGEIKIRRAGAEDWESLVTTEASAERGSGVLEMARAIREDRPHRATGALAFHVVDVMASITESIDTGAFVDVTSTVEVPAVLPDDWDVHAATL
jgi:predicted dehydrogenase